jgi:hypothetical protein
MSSMFGSSLWRVRAVHFRSYVVHWGLHRHQLRNRRSTRKATVNRLYFTAV